MLTQHLTEHVVLDSTTTTVGLAGFNASRAKLGIIMHVKVLTKQDLANSSALAVKKRLNFSETCFLVLVCFCWCTFDAHY